MIQINITKTNGTLKPYNHTKITESMVKAGANIETAKRIAEKIPNNIYDTITAEELRAIVNEELTILQLIINILMSVAMIVSVIATIWSGTDYLVKSKDVIFKSK